MFLRSGDKAETAKVEEYGSLPSRESSQGRRGASVVGLRRAVASAVRGSGISDCSPEAEGEFFESTRDSREEASSSRPGSGGGGGSVGGSGLSVLPKPTRSTAIARTPPAKRSGATSSLVRFHFTVRQ